MEGRLLIKNCALVVDGALRHQQALVIEGSRITHIEPDARVPVLPGDWEVAAAGRLLTPGRMVESSRFSELRAGLTERSAITAVSAWVCAQHLLSGATRVNEAGADSGFDEVAHRLGLKTGPASPLELNVGATADLILNDVVVPSLPRLTQLLTGVAVAWVITDGQVRVRERKLVGVDLLALARDCAQALSAP